MLLLKSIPKSIMADVAIKTFFSRLKEARMRPLIAPPVPNNPAAMPERAPPETELANVGFKINFLKINSIKLIEIRKTERAIDK